MRSNFPQRYEIEQHLFSFDKNKDKLEAVFKEAKTIKQRNELLLENCQYAYFYTDPSPATMKKLGFRFREFYRIMGGDVPDHIQNCIIKGDTRYTPRFNKLTKNQQSYVASNDPWIVYGWRNLFSSNILAEVNPKYEDILTSLELLGVPKEKFNETFLSIHHNQNSLNAAAMLPAINLDL